MATQFTTPSTGGCDDLETTINGSRVTIATNSFGMRSPEVTTAKDPASRRIAFLGDSFTFGLWATTEEESFVGVAREKLRNSSIEVLNFGVSG